MKYDENQLKKLPQYMRLTNGDLKYDNLLTRNVVKVNGKSNGYLSNGTNNGYEHNDHLNEYRNGYLSEYKNGYKNGFINQTTYVNIY